MKYKILAIIDQTDCWESFLYKKLDGSYTLPRNFREYIKKCLDLPNGLKVGMNVEILNKVALDTMLPGRIKNSTGGRLHIDYVCPPAESKVFLHYFNFIPAYNIHYIFITIFFNNIGRRRQLLLLPLSFSCPSPGRLV